VFRTKNNFLGGIHTIMRRVHNPTGTVDYPVDQTVIADDLCSFDSESDFRDTVGSHNPSVNPCDHLRTYMTMSKDVAIEASGASGSYSYDLTFTGNLPGYASVLGFPLSSYQNLSTFVGDLETKGGMPTYPSVDWETLEAKFLEDSKNILRNEVLLGETIAQPQLVIDAVRFLASPARGMGRFVKYVAKRYGKQPLRSRYTTGRMVRRVLQDASNSTLMYNFGVRPMISDLLGISHARRVVLQRVDYLKRHVGQYVPVRVRQSSSSDEYTSEYFPTYATIFKSPSRTRLTASMGAYFRVRDDLTLEANINAFLQYFGVGRLVGLVWELIPYSFVVDWVTNAQERLNKLTQVHTFNPYGDSRGFVASLRTEDVISVRLSSGVIHVWSATIPESFSGTELASVVNTRYTRFLDVPESRTLFDLSGFGLPQIINGGSLLIQQLLKNR
jgi:hypothetical protein